MYTGVIKNRDSQPAYLEELRNYKGSSLLVGNIFCAHCGNRLTLTTSGRK